MLTGSACTADSFIVLKNRINNNSTTAAIPAGTIQTDFQLTTLLSYNNL